MLIEEPQPSELRFVALRVWVLVRIPRGVEVRSELLLHTRVQVVKTVGHYQNTSAQYFFSRLSPAALAIFFFSPAVRSSEMTFAPFAGSITDDVSRLSRMYSKHVETFTA